MIFVTNQHVYLSYTNNVLQQVYAITYLIALLHSLHLTAAPGVSLRAPDSQVPLDWTCVVCWHSRVYCVSVWCVHSAAYVCRHPICTWSSLVLAWRSVYVFALNFRCYSYILYTRYIPGIYQVYMYTTHILIIYLVLYKYNTSRYVKIHGPAASSRCY